METITTQEAQHIAEEAYIYAFPMLMGYRFAYGAFLNPTAPGYRGSMNAIHPPHDGVQRANWLPAPGGLFYLTMRIYWPEPAALDGSWTPPPVRRVAE